MSAASKREVDRVRVFAGFTTIALAQVDKAALFQNALRSFAAGDVASTLRIAGELVSCPNARIAEDSFYRDAVAGGFPRLHEIGDDHSRLYFRGQFLAVIDAAGSDTAEVAGLAYENAHEAALDGCSLLAEAWADDVGYEPVDVMHAMATFLAEHPIFASDDLAGLTARVADEGATVVSFLRSHAGTVRAAPQTRPKGTTGEFLQIVDINARYGANLQADTVKRALYAGRVRAEKRGGRWFYDVDSIRRQYPHLFD